MSAEKIAEVLVQHLYDRGQLSCACDGPAAWNTYPSDPGHAAHVAEALTPLLAAEREAGRAEQLTDADRRNLAAVYGYELGHEEGKEAGRAEADAVRDREFGNLRWMDGHQQGLKDGRAEVRERVEALADEWEEWASLRSTPRIDAFRDAAHALRAALRDLP